MYYQNRRRQRPVPRIAFRIYALFWLIPALFFLAAPTTSGLLVAICIAITIWIAMATWQKPKGGDGSRPPPDQSSHRERSPRARLKQLPPSRYEGDSQGGKMTRYDDYEQPQAHYPEQRP